MGQNRSKSNINSYYNWKKSILPVTLFLNFFLKNIRFYFMFSKLFEKILDWIWFQSYSDVNFFFKLRKTTHFAFFYFEFIFVKSYVY